MNTLTSSDLALVERLKKSVNLHDLDALAECFVEDFVNETPVHPARSFRGSDQVRKNWAQIFAGVPDLAADIVRSSPAGGAVWLEWEMRGTRRDGAAHLMRGVTIFGVEAGLFTWVRFYLEPVQDDGIGVDTVIGQRVGA